MTNAGRGRDLVLQDRAIDVQFEAPWTTQHPNDTTTRHKTVAMNEPVRARAWSPSLLLAEEVAECAA
jgi:hypothetical protein